MQTQRKPRRVGTSAVIVIGICLALAVLVAAIQLAVVAVGVVVALVVIIALVAGWNVLMGSLGWHLPPPGSGDTRAKRFRRARRRGRSL
jgi:hypothetical protein